jgi:predicted amidohydrolase YtcJ
VSARADLLLRGGIVRTLDPRQPVADAVAVGGGRILGAGRASDLDGLVGPGTVVRDLEGGAVLPGFVDAHVHVWKVGQLATTLVDLRDATSAEDVYARVRARAAALPRGTWIQGRGWNEAAMAGEAPRRPGLDAAAPDHPVALTRACGHIHAVNAAALQVSGIGPDTPAPAGGAIDARRGRLDETAWGLVQRALPRPSRADNERWILEGAALLRAAGVTAASDAGVDPAVFAAYLALAAEGRLPLRMDVLPLLRPDLGGAPYALAPPVREGLLRYDTVKLFADGGLSGATAALSEPYRDGSGSGILRLAAEEIVELGANFRTRS